MFQQSTEWSIMKFHSKIHFFKNPVQYDAIFYLISLEQIS